MGNRRTGWTRGERGRHGTLPWREDPLILERVNLVRTLKAQGRRYSEMLDTVNELMRTRGAPEVTVDTIQEDYARVRALLAEERAEAAQVEDDARQRHIEALEEVIRQAWTAFQSASAASLNRSAYLNTIRAALETIGKFDGSLKDRIEHSGEVRTIQALLSDLSKGEG